MPEEIATTEEIIVPPVKKPRRKQMGLLILLLCLLALIGIFAFSSYQIKKINSSLARLTNHLQKQVMNDHQAILSLQKSLSEQQQTFHTTLEKQTQLMNELRSQQKGDVNKWQVAEAQYLVNLANDHVQFSHDVPLALILLKRADQVLANVGDPDILTIRKAVSENIAQLQSLPPIDVTALYSQLSALNKQIDQLPLPPYPLQAEPTTEVTPHQTNSWWQNGLNRTLAGLKQIVVVRNMQIDAALPLSSPQGKIFLYQNLHVEIKNAMWGLLQGQSAIYQTSLENAIHWIQEYFDVNAPLTKTTLLNLQTLRNINIAPPLTDLGATLKLFDQYISQSAKATTTQ